MAEEKDVPVKKEASAPARFDEQIESLFEDFFNRRWLRPFSREWPAWPAKLETGAPKVDVIDRESELVVRAELPGFSKDDLDVNVTRNTVTVKGSTRKEQEKEEGEYHHREIVSRTVSRTVPLPCDVDSASAKAKLKDGLLEVTVAKAKGAENKRIDIET
jgi:HSP20 family protein